MKNKKDIIYYTILGLIVVSMVVWEIYKPKPVDWTMYLEQEKSEPYGTYALYESLPDLFPDKKITTETRNLNDLAYSDMPIETNFIFITEKFAPSEGEIRLLLDYVDDGNNAFIAAQDFDPFFTSELDFSIATEMSFGKDSIELNFTNKRIKTDKPYIFQNTHATRFFEIFDFEDEYAILGTRNSDKPVYIRRKWGEGYFYIHLHPEVFTNYAMVAQPNEKYVYDCISYLPKDYDVIWDEYYKPNQVIEVSHLKYVFKNPGLKHAYQIVLVLLIIYTIFTAKRRQRIIPVIKPYKNTTLEFAETIGRLYYHSKNHKDIALKKLNFWQEHLRERYYFTNDELVFENYDKIAEKTGVEAEKLRKILKMAGEIEQSKNINDSTLSAFNTLIEDFYSQEN